MGILLHTMATPDRDPLAAFDLASKLRFDGVELVCQSGYRCGLAQDADLLEARRLGCEARTRGVPIACLVPYTQGIADGDAAVRQAAVERFRHAIDLAGACGAGLVRVLAGEEVDDEGWNPALGRLVTSLRTLASHATGQGVVLTVENHMDTMATSAERTRAICEAVNQPNLGILFDPANLATLRAEDFATALAIQAPYIRHVHVKDAVVTSDGSRRSVVPGQGADPWLQTISALQRQGYRGHYAIELEKRWIPELPAPEEALPLAKAFIDLCVAGLSNRSGTGR